MDENILGVNGNIFNEYIKKEEENQERYVGTPTSEESTRLEAQRLGMQIDDMVSRSEYYSDDECDAALKKLNAQIGGTPEVLLEYSKKFEGQSPKDMLKDYWGKLQEVNKIMSEKVVGPYTEEGAAKRQKEKFTKASNIFREMFSSKNLIEMEEAERNMSREDFVQYSKDWLNKNNPIDFTSSNFLFGSTLDVDKLNRFAGEDPTEEEKEKYLSSLSKEEMEAFGGMLSAEKSLMGKDLAERVNKSWRKGYQTSAGYRQGMWLDQFAEGSDEARYAKAVDARRKWVSGERYIGEMKRNMYNEAQIANAMSVIPFLDKAKKDLIAEVVSAEDRSRYEGVFALMTDDERKLMQGLVYALRPSEEMGFVSGFAQGIDSMASGGKRVLVNAFYRAFKDAKDQAQISRELDIESDFQRTVEWDKLVQPKGFWAKGWAGFGQSLPLQGLAIADALLFKGAGKAKSTLSKVGLRATGVTTTGLGILSMTGMQYDNMRLNGVKNEDALMYALAGGVVDWAIERANVDTYLGLGLKGADLQRIGMFAAVKAAANCFNKKEISKYGKKELQKHFWNTLRSDSKSAFKIMATEVMEEFAQGLNAHGFCSLAQGRELAESFLSSEAFEAGAKSFEEALPTCTIFGIAGTLFPVGSMFGLNTRGQTEQAASAVSQTLNERARRIALEKYGKDFTDEQLTIERNALKNRVAQAVEATQALPEGKRDEYIENLDASLREKALIKDAVEYHQAAKMTVGENAAKAFTQGNLQWFRYEKGGAKFTRDKDGKVTAVTFKDGDKDVTFNINDLTGKALTLEDISPQVLADFIKAYNAKELKKPAALRKMLNPDIASLSQEEKAELEGVVADGINGFYSESTNTITLTSKANTGTLAHETSHGVIEEAIERAIASRTDLGRRAVKRIRHALKQGTSDYDEKTAQRVEEKAFSGVEGGVGSRAGDQSVNNVEAAGELAEGVDGAALLHNIGNLIRRVVTFGKAKKVTLPVIRSKDAKAISTLDLIKEVIDNAVVEAAEIESRKRSEKELKANDAAERKTEAAERKATAEKIKAEREAKKKALMEAKKAEYQAKAAEQWDKATRTAEEEAKFWEDLEAEVEAELKAEEDARIAEDAAKKAQEEAEQARVEEETRKAEEALRAQEEAMEAKMRENRKNALKEPPRLRHAKNQDGETAQRAHSAYTAVWKAKMGQVVSDAEVQALGEEYSLPPEALNLKKTKGGWKVSDKQLLSDESLMRLSDALIRFWSDVRSVRIVVPDVVVSSIDEAANAVPNEVYDPITNTFVAGRVVVDPENAKSFREQAGLEETDVSPDELAARGESENKFSLREPSGAQKSANTNYPDAQDEIRTMSDTRFSIGRKAREEAKALILKKRPDLIESDTNALLSARERHPDIPVLTEDPTVRKEIEEEVLNRVVDEIGKFNTPKEQKAALHWFIKGAIRLPEDAPKVTEALKYADRAKGKANTDALSYDSPMAMIDALHEFKPKAKPINPDTVPELSDKQVLPEGVTTYLVQDDKQGQQAMRQIINTHWGEDANPWCLLHGDGKGNLSDGSNGVYDAWHYWNHYSALPKRVAFKNGKLLAFMATDKGDQDFDINDVDWDELHDAYYDEYEKDKLEYEEESGNEADMNFEEWMEEYRWEAMVANASKHSTTSVPEQWWDRQDQSHDGIPLGNIPVPNDQFGRWADFEIRDGEVKQIGGYIKGENGKEGFRQWYANGKLAKAVINGDYLEWFENGELAKGIVGDLSITFLESGELAFVYDNETKNYVNYLEEGKTNIPDSPEIADALRKQAESLYNKYSQKSDTRFSLVTPAEDAAYLDAVNRGDNEAIRASLLAASVKAGYSPDTSYRISHEAPINNGYNASLDDVKEMFGTDDRAELLAMGYGRYTARQAVDSIMKAKGNPDAMIDVWRAVPKNVKDVNLRRGDWVSLSEDYARQHGEAWLDGKYKLIHETVRAGSLFTDGNMLEEAGFDDGKERVYQNTKNGTKLLEVTYDDNGNVIPLSQRFNPRKSDIRFSLASAARYNEELYNKALEMEKRGESREKIFNETGGMWKDKDGHWLVELPEFTLNQIKELKDKVLQKIDESDKDYYGITYGDILNYIFPNAKSKLGKLVEVYPRLASLPIFFFKGEKTRGGCFGVTALNPSDNYKNNGLKEGQAVWIQVALGRDKLYQIRTTIVHELQHFIQGEEGWPNGTTYMKTAYTSDDKTTREIEYALNRGEINAKVAGLRSKPTSTKIKFAGKNVYPWETEQYIRDKMAQKVWNLRNSDTRFSLNVNPNLRADVEAALRKGTGANSQQKKRHEGVAFSNAPAIFQFVGIPSLPVVSDITRIRKMNIKHGLNPEQIAELPDRYQSPVAVMRDGNGYVILTDMMASSQHGENKPVRMFVRPVTWKTGERILLATALSENAVDELKYYEPRIKSGLLYADKNKIARLGLEEETESILRTQASGDNVKTPEDYSSWLSEHSVSQSAPAVNGGTSLRSAMPEGYVDTDAEGRTRFSIATYKDGGRKTLVDWFDNAVRNGEITRKDADDIITETDCICEVATRLANSGQFAHFTNWSEAVVELDKNGNPYFGVIRPNGDYAYNIDFSTVCKKRRPLDHVFTSLVEDGTITDENINLLLTEEKIPRIQDIIKAHGLEVACALCFVDSKRYKIGGVAKNFTALWNGIVDMRKKGGKEWNVAVNVAEKKPTKTFYDRAVLLVQNDSTSRVRLDAGQLVSGEGMDEFARKHPSIHDLYRSFGGVSKAKDSHGDVPFNNDIINPFDHSLNTKNAFRSITPAKAYAVGGVRLQSFSDFIPALFFDYAQMFAELAAKKLPLHTYTKEVDFVKIFGLTDAKINMSLVPAGTGIKWLKAAEGKKLGLTPVWGKNRKNVTKGGLTAFYDMSDETFPIADAFKLRDSKGNVGTIMVGISDEHISLCLDDPRIDMIIPYHKSSINPIVAKLRGIDKYEDYTLYQHTKGVKKEFFDFYPSLAETNDPRKTAAEYLAECKARGLKPKFSDSKRHTDFTTHENYYKLLADFRLLDEKGKYSPQAAIKTRYPKNLTQVLREALTHDQADADALDRETEPIKAEIRAEVFKMQGDFRKLKSLARPASPNKDTKFSWNLHDDANTIAALAGATHIIAGNKLDKRAMNKIARSLNATKDVNELLRLATNAANEQKAVLDYIAADPELDRLISRAGKAQRYSKVLERTRQADVAWTLGVNKKVEDEKRALAREVRDIDGLTADEIFGYYGLDPQAMLLAMTPPERKSPETDNADDADEAGVTPQPITPEILAKAQEAARSAIEKAKQYAAEAREKAKNNPIEEKNGDESNGKSEGEEDGGSTEDAYMTTFTKAFRRAIKESGITLDSAAEMVKLAEVMTEEYVRDNAHLYNGINLNNMWSDPRVLALLAGNIGSFAKMAADNFAPSYTRERVFRNIQLLRDNRLTKLNQIEEMGVRIFKDLNKDLVRQSRASLIKEIHKVIDKHAKNHKDNVLNKDRKVESELSQWLKFVKKAIDMSSDAVERRTQELERDLIAMYGSVDSSEADKFRDGYLKKMELAVLSSEYGNLKDRMPAEILAARDELAQGVDESMFRMMEGGEEFEREANGHIEAIQGGIVGNPKNEGFKPEKTPFLYSLLGMWEARSRYMIRYQRDEAKHDAALKSLSHLEELMQKSFDTQANYMNAMKGRLIEVLVNAYGSQSAAHDALSEEIKDAEWFYRDGNKRVKLTLGRALQMYVSIVQSDYAHNVEKHGRDGEFRRRLEELLDIHNPDSPHLKLVEGMRQLYLEMGGDLDKVLYRTTGTHLRTPNKNYMPVKMNNPLEAKMGEGRAFKPFAASLTPRVKNGLDFDQEADIMDMFQSRLQDTSHTIAFAESGPMIIRIAQSKRVLTAIDSVFGTEARNEWVKHILDIVSGVQIKTPKEARVLQAIMRYASPLWLGFNPASWAKQLASIPCYVLSSEVGLFGLARAQSMWLTNPVKMLSAAKDLTATEAWKARYGTAINQELRYTIGDTSSAENLWQKWVSASMSGISAFDKLGILVNAGLYARRREELEMAGKSQEEASELASEWVMHLADKTMQSGREVNMTEAQRSGGMGAFLQFKSSPMQMLQFELVAMAEYKANPSAKNFKKLVEVVLVNHVIAPSIMGLIDIGMTILTSWGIPDEEKRKALLTRLLGEFLTGPYSAMFVLGSIIEGAVDIPLQFVTGEKASRGSPRLLPSEGALEFVMREGRKVGKAMSEIGTKDLLETMGEIGMSLAKVTPTISWGARTADKIRESIKEQNADPREKALKERRKAARQRRQSR